MGYGEIVVLRQAILGILDNLESLIILDANFLFNFVHKVNGKIVPLKFLTHSLKRVYIPLVDHRAPCVLSVKSVAWLLVFCPHLRQAALSFTIHVSDFQFLQEYRDSIKKVSKVKDLALRFVFIHQREDKKTWWGLASEFNQGWIGGNKKTEIVHRMLEITNELDSLEVSFQFDDSNPGDRSLPFSSCLAGACSSFDSLRHLRLFELKAATSNPATIDFSSFKNLRVLSSNFAYMDKVDMSLLLLPPKLEIVSLDFYTFDEGMPFSVRFLEERALLNLLQSNAMSSLSSFREVVVPRTPHHSAGLDYSPLDQKSGDIWRKNRKALGEAEIFKSGVKLRTFKPGDSIGEC